MRITLAAFVLIAATASANAQVTTRIETRPYYGAITTVEHGVRVTRSLPPHDRIIINPNGATPLSLNIGTGHGGDVVQNTTTHNTVTAPAASHGVGVAPGYALHPGVRYPIVPQTGSRGAPTRMPREHHPKH